MPAAYLQIDIEQGADLDIAFGPWLQANGDPYSLADVQIKMMIKQTQSESDEAIVTLDSNADDGSIVIATPSTAGKWAIHIPESITSTLAFSQPAYYDMKAYFPGSPQPVRKLFYGPVYLIPGVTTP